MLPFVTLSLDEEAALKKLRDAYTMLSDPDAGRDAATRDAAHILRRAAMHFIMQVFAREVD